MDRVQRLNNFLCLSSTASLCGHAHRSCFKCSVHEWALWGNSVFVGFNRQRRSLLCNHIPKRVVRTDGGKKSALQHDRPIQRLCWPRLDRKVRAPVLQKARFPLTGRIWRAALGSAEGEITMGGSRWPLKTCRLSQRFRWIYIMPKLPNRLRLSNSRRVFFFSLISQRKWVLLFAGTSLWTFSLPCAESRVGLNDLCGSVPTQDIQ